MGKIGRDDYEERREARIERLEKGADKARAEGNRRIGAAKRTAAIIPLGQPILVGHHSEKRHRRDIKRIDDGYRKGFEALETADALARRAASATANETISSDDPNALVRLREKLAETETMHARWKAISQAYKRLEAAKTEQKKAAAEDAIRALALTETEQRTLDLSRGYGSKVYVSFKLTNGNKEIRRIEDRIKALEAKAAAAEKPDETIGQAVISEAENRVRIRFPGKPSLEIIKLLKRSGFRWSPTSGCWQRFANTQAWHIARDVARAAARALEPGGVSDGK